VSYTYTSGRCSNHSVAPPAKERGQKMAKPKKWQYTREQMADAQDTLRQDVLQEVAVAWHTLAPQLVRIAEASGLRELVWVEAARLLADATEVPPMHHECNGITCKLGYAHAAGF